MKAVSARMTEGINIGSLVKAADNSGARVVRITGVKGKKVRKGKQVACKVGDWVKVSVREGKPEMKGEVFGAVVVRQKKPWRRLTGERIGFTDNAVALLKDEFGNPKGTQIKGPVAREIVEKWEPVAKIARMAV